MGEIAREHVSRFGNESADYEQTYLVVHVTIDAFRLREPESARTELQRVLAVLAERDALHERLTVERMAALTRFLLPVVLAGVAGPVGHGIGYLVGLGAGALFEPARASIEKGLEKVVEETLKDYAKKKHAADAPPKTDETAAAKALGRAVVFVDDLDRCGPAEAFRVLSVVAQLQARLADALRDEPSKFVRFVYSLDPEVMAQHFAKIFGVSESAGMEAMLKYIQAPFTLPPAANSKHSTTLQEAAFGRTKTALGGEERIALVDRSIQIESRARWQLMGNPALP